MEMNKLEFLSTKNISMMLNIPIPTVTKVLKSLNQGRLITTKEGAKGGILLFKSPEKITLLEVFECIENQDLIFKTHFDFTVDNDRVNSIKKNIKDSFSSADRAMKEVLKANTIKQLMG